MHALTFTTFAVATALTAGICYAKPDILPERFSRQVLRFLIFDLALTLFYCIFIFPFFVSKLRHLPSPKNYDFIFGNGVAQFSKPLGGEFLKWQETIPNDGLIRFRSFFNVERLMPTSAEALKAILSDNAYDFEKPAAVRKFLVKILGLGLILSEGDVHKFQRKNVLPSFSVQNIRALNPIFWKKAVEMVDAISKDLDHQKQEKPGQDPVVEFGEWTTRVTLDIIGLAGMGKNFNAVSNSDDPLVAAYQKLLEPGISKTVYFAANILGPQDIVQKLPVGENDQLRSTTGAMRDACLDLVRSKKEIIKKGGNPGSDILALLVQSNNFSDSELIDQMLTFLAAGHETTSSVLSWAAYLLAVNPTWQARLREEVREHLPSLDTSEVPSGADVDALPILNAVCQETLRLYPTVPMTIREAIRDTHIGTQRIPSGTRIMLVPWAINRSSHFWGPNANEFVPERWLADGAKNTGGASTNYAQITFLHGSRSCVGMGFAKAEFKCILAAVVGRYEIEMADPNEKIWPAGVVTTKPANGMHIKLKAVDGW